MSHPEVNFEPLARKAEAALQSSGVSGDTPPIDEVLVEIQAAMAESVDARRSLGPFVGRLRAAARAAAESPIDWVPVLDGHLAIGHRPRVKTIKNMRTLGATHVLTLLSESEGAESIGREARRGGLDWIWLPLPSAEPPGDDQRAAITKVFDAVQAALNDPGRIYVHCSAGIHRTGMITHAFLRHAGLPADEAMKTLARLRQETADGVGDERMRWGLQFAR